MKLPFAASLLAGLLAAAPADARLPQLLEKPFLGCFIAYENKDFDFALGADGEAEILFKDKKKRISSSLAFKVRYVLEEKVGNKWVRRAMQQEGFETDDKEVKDPEKPVTFVATHTGDTKVQVIHEFKGDQITIATGIVAKKTKNPVRVAVEVVVPDLYRHLKDLDKRELRNKTKGTRLNIQAVGERSAERVSVHEDVNLAEKFDKGAKGFRIDSDRIGHKVSLETLNPAYGSFRFRQRGDLYKGFQVLWWPDESKSDDKECRLVITVK